MSKTAIDANVNHINNQNNKDKVFPTEIRFFKEFINSSKLVFSKYQEKSKFSYYRELGSNFFQSVSYIFIEEVLKFGSVNFIINWLENLKSEASDFFKCEIFVNKIPQKYINSIEKYKKSENAFFEILEKYVDLLLNGEKNRVHLAYDFFWHCANSVEIRTFCIILMRKMVSLFYSENYIVCKKMVSNSTMKIYDLDEESFSTSELYLLSYSINFRIYMYQVIRNAEMKQEVFQNFKGKDPYGHLSLIIYENKYYSYYCDAEKVEIEAEIKSKNEKLMNSIKNNDEMNIELPNNEKKIDPTHSNHIIIDKENAKKKEGEILYDIDIEKSDTDKYKVKAKSKIDGKIVNLKESTKIIEIEDDIQEQSIKIQNKGGLQKDPDPDIMEIENNEKKESEKMEEKMDPPNKLHKIEIEEEKMEKSRKKSNDEQKEIKKNSEYNPNIKIINSPNKNMNSPNKNINSPLIKKKPLDNSSEKPQSDKKNETINEFCVKCCNNHHEKPLFKINSCEHTICFNCMINKYYISENMSPEFFCPSIRCSGKIRVIEIENYFQMIQLTDSSKEAEKTMKNDKNQTNESLEPHIQCICCMKSTPQTKIFCNPLCLHCFCHECAIKKYENNRNEYSYCPSRDCLKLVFRKNLEKYFFEYTNQEDGKQGNSENKNISQHCYNCDKEVKINLNENSEMEIFKCPLCKKISCLVHKAPLINCYCFCESCNIKTESDLIHITKKICVNCRKKYCILCKNSTFKCQCYCQSCDSMLEESMEEKSEKFCKNCQNICEKCRVSINKNKKIINEKCGHIFCRECMYRFLDKFKKSQCVLEHSYY